MEATQGSASRLFWLIVLSLFLPPVAVAIEFGACSTNFFVNLVLFIIFPLFGFVHALYILVRARYWNPSQEGYIMVVDEEGPSNGPHAPHPHQHVHSHQHHQQNQQHQHQQHQHQQQRQTPAIGSAPSSSAQPSSTAKNQDGIQTAPRDPPPYADHENPGLLDNKVQRNN